MIVHGCIEIHPKGCRGWIILMGFRVLLIMHYLIREILVDGVLDVHTKGIKIQSFSIQSSLRNTCVGMHMKKNHMFLTIP